MPIGADDPQPEGDRPGTAELIELTRGRGYRTFPGRLDESRLGLGERLITRVMHSPSGDVRDRFATHAWAAEIVSELQLPTV